MNVSSFISESVENAKYVITTQYAKEAEIEDPHAFRMLIEHIQMKNAHRIIIFSVFSFICGIICLIFGEHSALGITGGIVLTAASPIFLWLTYKAAYADKPVYRTMRIISYLYWVCITAGGVLVSVSEHLADKTPYFFLIFFAAVVSVPIVSLYESLFFAAVILVTTISYGVTTDKGLLYIIAAIALTVAYMWLSSVIRCCYSSIWLGRRRIEFTEERCIQLSRKDTLTGLLNKSGLSEKFSELAAQNKDAKNMSVVLIDIDNFRLFNHVYGYDKSDECLYRVCNCIRIVSKPYTELISRFGGDEFVLIFEDKDEIEIVKIAEQLRQSVETMAQPFGKSIVTVSVGISGVSEKVDRTAYAELLKDADRQPGYFFQIFTQVFGRKEGHFTILILNFDRNATRYLFIIISSVCKEIIAGAAIHIFQ